MSTRLSMRSRNGHSRLTAALDVEPSRTLRVARTVRVRIRYLWTVGSCQEQPRRPKVPHFIDSRTTRHRRLLCLARPSAWGWW